MRRGWHLQTVANILTTEHNLLDLFPDLCRCVQPKHDWHLFHFSCTCFSKKISTFSFILGCRLLSVYKKTSIGPLWVCSTFSKFWAYHQCLAFLNVSRFKLLRIFFMLRFDKTCKVNSVALSELSPTMKLYRDFWTKCSGMLEIEPEQ